VISLLCPTRGRPASLAVSVNGLLDLADTPSEVEVLIAVDPDDTGVYVGCEEGDGGKVWVWQAPERYGYRRLHEYYNALAAIASGEWLMIWNDDAVMLTSGWDTLIAAQPPGVLWMKANHCAGGNLFPAWPAAWTRALGHVSLSPHCDMWIQHLGQGLGCQRQVPVEILHDRKDVTGGHDDATYAEGRGPLGPNGTAGPFPFELVRADVEVIRSLQAVRM
jgi:hypothetical protein